MYEYPLLAIPLVAYPYSFPFSYTEKKQEKILYVSSKKLNFAGFGEGLTSSNDLWV